MLPTTFTCPEYRSTSKAPYPLFLGVGYAASQPAPILERSSLDDQPTRAARAVRLGHRQGALATQEREGNTLTSGASRGGANTCNTDRAEHLLLPQTKYPTAVFLPPNTKSVARRKTPPRAASRARNWWARNRRRGRRQPARSTQTKFGGVCTLASPTRSFERASAKLGCVACIHPRRGSPLTHRECSKKTMAPVHLCACGRSLRQLDI
jgi:hypothetical protein